MRNQSLRFWIYFPRLWINKLRNDTHECGCTQIHKHNLKKGNFIKYRWRHREVYIPPPLWWSQRCLNLFFVSKPCLIRPLVAFLMRGLSTGFLRTSLPYHNFQPNNSDLILDFSLWYYTDSCIQLAIINTRWFEKRRNFVLDNWIYVENFHNLCLCSLFLYE